MMPPKDMKPSELWLALTEMPRPFRLVPFPRKGGDGNWIGSLAMRPLTQEEVLRAGIAAETFVRTMLPDAVKDSTGYETAYANAAAVEQLWRACREATDTDRPFFPTPKAIAEVCTADEVSALYDSYLTVRDQIGPLLSGLSDAEANAWIDRLIEGGEALDPFGCFSSAALRTLLRLSVGRLRSFTTPRSSPGTQPDGTQPGRSSGSAQASMTEPSLWESDA